MIKVIKRLAIFGVAACVPTLAAAMSSSYPFRIDSQCFSETCSLTAINGGPVPVMVQVTFVDDDNVMTSRPSPFFDIVGAHESKQLVRVSPRNLHLRFAPRFTPIAELGDPRNVANASITGYTRVLSDLSPADESVMSRMPECDTCPFLLSAHPGEEVHVARSGVIADSDTNVFVDQAGRQVTLGELLVAHRDGTFAHYIGVDWAKNLPKRGAEVNAGDVIGRVPPDKNYILFGLSIRQIDPKKVLVDRYLPVQFGEKPVSVAEALKEVQALAADKRFDGDIVIERHHIPPWVLAGVFLGSMFVMILAVYWAWMRFGKKVTHLEDAPARDIGDPVALLVERLGSREKANDEISDELFRNPRRYRGSTRFQVDAAARTILLKRAADSDSGGSSEPIPRGAVS